MKKLSLLFMILCSLYMVLNLVVIFILLPSWPIIFINLFAIVINVYVIYINYNSF